MKSLYNGMPNLARFAGKAAVYNRRFVSSPYGFVSHCGQRVLIRQEEDIGHAFKIFPFLRSFNKLRVRQGRNAVLCENSARIGDG